MDKYGYKITAFNDGRKVTLAQYTGDTEGLYRFTLERFKICTGKEDGGCKVGEEHCREECGRECGRECCGDENLSLDGASCTCTSE